MQKKTTSCAIIGSGPGGVTAALQAAKFGVDVTLIEAQKVGGICLHEGCIPSKALLHVAKLLSESKEANDFGIEFSAKLDWAKLRSWNQSVIQKLYAGLHHLIKKQGISLIQGEASFLDSSSLLIRKSDGCEEKLSFDKAIIATGSRPIMPSWIKRDSSCLLDSQSALQLNDIPRTLLVVGGGYIGLELGTVYARLGSQVTIIEMTGQWLAGIDSDLMAVLQKRLHKTFKTLHLQAKLIDIHKKDNSLCAKWENEKKETTEEEFEKILMAVGRQPNTEHCGLENTQAQMDEDGFIKANEKCQTDDPSIFAIGDVTGPPMLAHKASAEARMAVEVIAGQTNVARIRTIPAVVFTDPEIATCGLSETQAKKENRPVKIEKFSWMASGRATTLKRNDGLTKIIVDPQSEKILGMGIVGVGAGELIAQGVIAVDQGLKVSDIASSIYPHPTLSETIGEAALNFYQ
ncbi:MAG: dihydrolipoyl dehydrogenase [Candidatus Omnitrophota bacterium]